LEHNKTLEKLPEVSVLLPDVVRIKKDNKRKRGELKNENLELLNAKKAAKALSKKEYEFVRSFKKKIVRLLSKTAEAALGLERREDGSPVVFLSTLDNDRVNVMLSLLKTCTNGAAKKFMLAYAH